MTSPLIKERLGVENGTIKGKGGVGKWWKRVLDKIPDLKTEFIAFAESIDSVVLVQKISYTDKMAGSNFYFNEEGKIKKEIYFG